MSELLKIDSNGEARQVLENKFQSIFQEYSVSIFNQTDEQLQTLVQEQYRPRCELILTEREGALDELDDNINTPEFLSFLRAVFKLCLHMVLNDPPITLGLQSLEERQQKEALTDQFEFWQFSKKIGYYCIDGFPKEGSPCVVVLPPPYRSGYVYQGIKPAVIVLDGSDADLVGYVKAKQEELEREMALKKKESLVQDLVDEKVEQPQAPTDKSPSVGKRSVIATEDHLELEKTIEKLRLALEEKESNQKSKQRSHNKSSHKSHTKSKKKSNHTSAVKISQRENVSPLRSTTSYTELSQLKKSKTKSSQKVMNKSALVDTKPFTVPSENCEEKTRFIREFNEKLLDISNTSNCMTEIPQNNSSKVLASAPPSNRESSSSIQNDTQEPHLRDKLQSLYNDYINVKNRNS